MLLCFSDGDHCIESSSGIKEGSRIYITGGSLEGVESIIKKLIGIEGRNRIKV